MKIIQEFEDLYQKAFEVAKPQKLSKFAESAGVGAAIQSESGAIFQGVCVDTSSSMGFCAEHAAAAAMLTSGESRVKKMVAVNWEGKVFPPCGRCREFISQLHPENVSAQILVGPQITVTLGELLPYNWQLVKL